MHQKEGFLTIYIHFFNGSGIISEYDKRTGISKTTIEIKTTENPPVKLDGEKLKFIVNDNEIDITEKISNTVPYIGEYTDEQNVTHKFIVGGKPIEEGYGYEEHLFDGNGKFLGSSGYYGSKVPGIDDGNEPEWLVVGKSIIGRNEQ